MATSNELKELGNKAFAEKDYETSIKHFTAAIELDPQNHVLYSNRSASFASLFKYEEALSDAEKTIEIKPDWVKGYGRKGAALQGLKRVPDALKAFSDGLKLDGTNKQCLDGVEAMKSELFANSDPGFAKISHVFKDPKAWETIASNPRTAAFASDPEFKAKITMLQQNPQLLQSMLSDFRIMQALGVLLNINKGNDGEDGVEGSDLKMEVSDDDEEKPQPAEAPKKEEPKKEEPKKEEPKKEADAGAAQEEAADEGTPASKIPPETKKKALAEKELGTAAYKKKDFPTALKHYNAARELDPTDIVFYLNISAVYIETKDYDNCIKECEKALEVGSENRADYELIAKAQARMAKAYADSNRLEEAIKWYGKAISNKRSPDYVKAKNELEKTLKEKKRQAYINPELSAKHKDQGNDLFKAGKFAEALEQYTEAIQRNPSDGKLYSNRAATYAKLARFDLSLQDCEECLKLEPTFVKGHLRKGNALVFMKKYSEAMSAFEEAKRLDPANAEADQGIRTCYENMYTGNREERAKQAMNDPEIQSILGDPVMQMILQQMSSDPTAVREHLKNPEISRKISKLAQAGILEMR